MRILISAIAVLTIPILPALADEDTPSETALPAAEMAFPEQMTPEALGKLAVALDELSRKQLVDAPGETGGRGTADARRTKSIRTAMLSSRLQSAADGLAVAQAGYAETSETLAAAKSEALSAALEVAENVSNPALSQQLSLLLDIPEDAPPAPVTHVFCMEATGAGPRTFASRAPEALTQAIPYVQGYISHDITQTAPFKLRLSLTVEHDANAAPFGAIDALHAANKAAVDDMNDPQRQAAETILMGDLAERLCSPTPPRGQ